MGRTVVSAVRAAPGLEVSGLFDPGCVGEVIDGLICGADYEAIASSDVVVEFTRPDVVMENLAQWHELGLNVVVGTSGFDDGPAWNSVNISMGSDTGWEDFGSSDFLADLSNVSEVGFRLTYLESTLGQVYAFDNLQRHYGTPEPETYAALSFALICLGFTFRRKIEGSMSSAMAMIKS